MNRTRVKSYHKHKKTRRQRSAQSGHTLNHALIIGGILLASIIALSFITNGSAGRRLLMLALPVTYSAQEPEYSPGEPITILRVDVDEGVGDDMRIEVLSPKTPTATELGGGEPKILIYHTHATEAYTQTDTYTYKETTQWRTNDNARNVVAIGEALTKALRSYGFNVLHDTSDHEPPALRSAYSRSEETMLAYKKKYPSLVMFIDVHRDAGKDPSYVTIDGKRVAKIMFVVGTGEGATGTGFGQMPDFESNYALALDITNRLAAVNPQLARNIRVKTGRYNQHVSNKCLLVEMGDNANTLEEILNSVPYLAAAIAESANSTAVETYSNAKLWAP